MFASLADSTDPALRELVFSVLADGLHPRDPACEIVQRAGGYAWPAEIDPA
jgi:hypothetical protein